MAIRDQILDKKIDKLLDSLPGGNEQSVDSSMMSAAYVNQYLKICTDARILAKSGDAVIPQLVERWPSLAGLQVLFALVVFENVKNHTPVQLILEKATAGGQIIQQCALQALSAIADPSVRAQVEELTRSDNHVIREEAVHCLVAIGPHESFPVLRELINDEESDIRLAVIESLNSVDDPSVISLLFDALADPQMGVAYHAKQHLKKLVKQHDFSSDLIAGLDRKGRYTRDYVIELMGAVKDELFIQPLIDHYEICDNKKRRELILRTLAKYKNKQILKVLALAVSDRVKDVQIYALKLIKRFKWTECTPILVDCAITLARRSEESYLSHPLGEVYVKAVSAIKDSQAGDLLKLLSKHPDGGIQKETCTVLAQRGVTVEGEDIQELLKTTCFSKLRSIINADSKTTQPHRSSEPAEELIDNAPPEKIAEAPDAGKIAKMTDREVIACAADCFGKNVHSPENLINRLAKIGGSESILLLRSQLQHTRITVRAGSVDALLRLGVSDLTNKDLVLTVLSNVRHLQHKVREYGQAGIDATIEYLSFPVSGSYGVDLLNILEESNHPKRFDVFTKLLGNPSDKEVIKTLTSIVKNTKTEMEPLITREIINYDTNSRWGVSHIFECINIAGIYKSTEVVDKLIELIQSENKKGYIRACADALGRIKDKRAVVPLIDAVTWAEEGPALNAVMTSLVKFKANEAVDTLNAREIKRPAVAKKRDECVAKLNSYK